MEKKKAIHDGHRSRMRDRFLKTGLNGFQPHEILELLLFYAIPRKNTNPIAHNLLEAFGSLEGVLSADVQALASVEGMTQNAAVFIQVLKELRQLKPAVPQQNLSLNAADNAGEFFVRQLAAETKEVICAAFLNDSLRLQACVILAEGHPSASELTVRKITETAFSYASNYVILAHNHPQGTAVPSPEDIGATRYLIPALKENGIVLLDHMIISGSAFNSLRKCGAFLGL